MKYDFQTVVDRRNVGAFTWEEMRRTDPTVGDDIVPLSVADMEFKNPPEIIEGLKHYLDGAVLGYTEPTEQYLSAVCGWMERRHSWKIDPEWIVTTPGVVPALYASVQVFTQPGDGVLIMTPVYYPFYEAMTINDRRVVKTSLINNGGRYEIDFDDFEAKAKESSVKLLLLCSPHNPVGRVWTREELERIGRICIDNNVLVVSDEIHFDLVMPGYKHIMFGSISEEFAQHSIVCTAPSKTFNLAGMQASNMIIANEQLREKFVAHFDAAAIYYLNILSYKACEIAYTKCDQWLEELLGVIRENRDYVAGYLAKHHPQVKVTPIEATYLLWMDFRALGMDNEALEALMQKDARLFLDEGYVFGEDGSGFERMNLACPKSVVEAAMARLTAALENHGR